MLNVIVRNVRCGVLGTTTGHVLQAGSHDACNANANNGLNVLGQQRLHMSCLSEMTIVVEMTMAKMMVMGITRMMVMTMMLTTKRMMIWGRGDDDKEKMMATTWRWK